jgi:citronellol/citronellal dehydrogenase
MPSSAIFRPGLFEGRVALVTGGGSGIGLAITRMLGELGAKVAIASRKQERLDAARADLATQGIDVYASTCDIREVEQVSKLTDDVAKQLGRIDVLVNNAGGQFPTAAEALAPKGWDAVIRNNLNGTFYMTQAVATKSMIPRRKGRIVNVIANIARGTTSRSTRSRPVSSARAAWTSIRPSSWR